MTPTTDRLGRFTDPSFAALRLYNSWKLDDRGEAAGVAPPSAVDDLFARPFQPLRFESCSPSDLGYFSCRFTGEGLSLAMRVTGGASVGYGVESLSIT